MRRLRLCLVNGTTCRIPSPVGHLPRSIFLAKNYASWFALSESSDYIHNITADFQMFHPFAVELINTVIFQQMLGNRPSKSVFANYHHRWNVSGEIVSAHLAGRSLACCSRLLVGPPCVCLGTFGLFYERYQACWISQRKLRNQQDYLIKTKSHSNEFCDINSE